MEKYINAERLIEEFKSIHPDSQLMYASAFAEFVKDAPAADVAPVIHGKWMLVRKFCGGASFKCSVCERQIDVWGWYLLNLYPYCNCGAKMDVENI